MLGRRLRAMDEQVPVDEPTVAAYIQVRSSLWAVIQAVAKRERLKDRDKAALVIEEFAQREQRKMARSA